MKKLQPYTLAIHPSFCIVLTSLLAKFSALSPTPETQETKFVTSYYIYI